LSPDGNFEIREVVPGLYDLVAMETYPGVRFGAQPEGRIAAYARVPIDAGAADIRDLVVELRPGVSLAGRLAIDPGAGSRPLASPEGIIVRLVPEDALFGAAVPPAVADAAGEFRMAALPPGRYRIGASLPAGAYLREA